MKILLSTIALLFAFASGATGQDHNFGQIELMNLVTPNCSLISDCDDDDDNDNYGRVCSARDAQGHVFKYYLHWHEDNYVQRQAVKKCKQGSKRPETCRPVGCQRIN